MVTSIPPFFSKFTFDSTSKHHCPPTCYIIVDLPDVKAKGHEEKTSIMNNKPVKKTKQKKHKSKKTKKRINE